MFRYSAMIIINFVSTRFFTKHTCKKVETIKDATIKHEFYAQITPTSFLDVKEKLDQIQEEYRKTVGTSMTTPPPLRKSV